jgi:hypothetical protein
MAMPTSAPVIAPIFAVTNEMTLTTTPMVYSTTATVQDQPFPLKRPYVTTSDAIPRGINSAPNTVKIDPLPCASAVCSLGVNGCCPLNGSSLPMTLGLTFATKGMATMVAIPPSNVKAPAITKRIPNIVTPVGL